MKFDPEMFGREVGATIKDALAATKQRIAELEQRLAELEKHGSRQAGMSYLGNYQPAQTYSRGSVVHYRSALWVANTAADANEPPSANHGQWSRLAQDQGHRND